MATSSDEAMAAFASIGIDTGNDVFHIIGFDPDGRIVLPPQSSGWQAAPPDCPRTTWRREGRLRVRNCPSAPQLNPSALERMPLKNSKSGSGKFSARRADNRKLGLDLPPRAISESHAARVRIWRSPRPIITTAPVRPENFPIRPGNGVFQRHLP